MTDNVVILVRFDILTSFLKYSISLTRVVSRISNRFLSPTLAIPTLGLRRMVPTDLRQMEPVPSGAPDVFERG